MFAVGVLAHSLLLPFLGIFLQVFVVNFCLKVPSELPVAANAVEVLCQAPHLTAGNSCDTSTFSFNDFWADSDVRAEATVNPQVAAATFLLEDDHALNSGTTVFFSLRAPPRISF